MAVITDLIRVVSELTGHEHTTVNTFARQAREAGLISQRGRGVNAAIMTPTDATNLLIAVCANPLAKDVPETIRRFRALPADHLLMNFTTPFREHSNFGADLDFLIGAAMEGELGLSYEGLLEKSISKSYRRAALKRRLELPLARMEIEFRRAEIEAEIRIVSPYFFPSKMSKIAISSNTWAAYGSPRGKEIADGPIDLRERAIVTDRTIRSLGEILKPRDKGEDRAEK